MLEQECRDAGVEIRCNAKVTEVRRTSAETASSRCRPGRQLRRTRLVVAPELSCENRPTSFVTICSAFGLKIEPTRCLVLLFSERDEALVDLAGVQRGGCFHPQHERTLTSFPKTCSHSSASAGPHSPNLFLWMARTDSSDLAPGRDLTADLGERPPNNELETTMREVLPAASRSLA